MVVPGVSHVCLLIELGPIYSSLADSLWFKMCEDHNLLKSYNGDLYGSGHTLVQRPGRVAQSATCLATDASLTADPGVVSSIPAQSHTLLEINYKIISTVILIPSAESFKKDCCKLEAKICARTTG